MTFEPVQMNVNRPVVAQELPDQNEALTQKLDKLGTGDFILIRLLILSSPKFLLSRERRIDINQPHSRRTICVPKIPCPLQIQQVFHHLQVVSEDEHVMPSIAVLA